jgi:hypothetical protein
VSEGAFRVVLYLFAIVNLALGAIATAAVSYGLHAVNHAIDTEEARSDARGWVDTGLLALGAVVLAYLAQLASWAK